MLKIIIPVVIVAVIGLILGLGLALASKFMSVPVNEKQEKIRACLPGANCGACGYSGCDGYAAAITEGIAEPDKCAPGGETTANAIGEILGIDVKSVNKIAFIACQNNSKPKYKYDGNKSCLSASLVHGGTFECQFACIGYGDCAKACPFNAIKIENGKAVICEEICKGCSKCIAVCPKSLISLVPKSNKPQVRCSNLHKGVNAIKVCTTSCIACGVCVKSCESGAITLKNNVAVIDFNKCTNCGKCKTACKRNAII